MKRTTITSPEQFKKIILEEFLPTLHSCNQGIGLSYDFPHDYICTVTVAMRGMHQRVFSIYKDANTNYAEWCYGVIGKSGGKNIN